MPFDIRNHPKEKHIENFFLSPEKKEEPVSEIKETENTANQKENHDRDIICQWQAPEFQSKERSRRWYLIASLILIAVISYAVISNNPIMAITFVLIGVVGYIYLRKDPRILTFRITREGIAVENDLYPFENIESFWIFYDPPETKLLSLKTGGKMTSSVHMPIHREDPTEIRSVLLDFIPEEKQELTVIDTIERLLHI